MVELPAPHCKSIGNDINAQTQNFWTNALKRNFIITSLPPYDNSKTSRFFQFVNNDLNKRYHFFIVPSLTHTLSLSCSFALFFFNSLDKKWSLNGSSLSDLVHWYQLCDCQTILYWFKMINQFVYMDLSNLTIVKKDEFFCSRWVCCCAA